MLAKKSFARAARRAGWCALGGLILLAAGCCGGKGSGPARGALVDLTGARGKVALGGRGARRVLVYLHGRCDLPGDAAAFVASATAQGHLVAPEGDEPCPGGKGTAWSSSVDRVQQRIDEALNAAENTGGLGASWDRNDVVLIGYSQGADRAENLAAKFPGRYRRVVLLGAPDAPSARALAGTTAVALLAGERDRRDLMMQGEASLRQAGKRVKFWLLPGAEHGDFGPQGNQVMGEALAFVLAP